jgi:hypothetical protein
MTPKRPQDAPTTPLSADHAPPGRPHKAPDHFLLCPPNSKKEPVSRQKKRALCRTRTDDPFLTMEVLYQLS